MLRGAVSATQILDMCDNWQQDQQECYHSLSLTLPCCSDLPPWVRGILVAKGLAPSHVVSVNPVPSHVSVTEGVTILLAQVIPDSLNTSTGIPTSKLLFVAEIPVDLN